jgi:excisionase family DNA binding protein
MDLITSGEVMEILRISKSTLHRWISNGKLKTYRTGKKLKFNYKEVMEVIEEYNPALKNISTNVKHRRHPEDSFTNEEAVIDSSGHELRVFKDHQTEKKTADEYRVMERCPTSNEQTLAVKQFDKEHYPFDKYDKEGIVCKINTDDPEYVM